MRILLTKEELSGPGALEIAVKGFKGDDQVNPCQVFVEFYGGKLMVHVWDGSAEDPEIHEIQSQ